MNDIVTALALIGAYSLGIISVLFAIYYFVLRDDKKKQQNDEMAMAEAVGVVKTAMPGSTVLSTEPR